MLSCSAVDRVNAWGRHFGKIAVGRSQGIVERRRAGDLIHQTRASLIDSSLAIWKGNKVKHMVAWWEWKPHCDCWKHMRSCVGAAICLKYSSSLMRRRPCNIKNSRAVLTIKEINNHDGNERTINVINLFSNKLLSNKLWREEKNHNLPRTQFGITK